MASRTCMNTSCGASSSTEWKKGWAMRSGAFSTLCSQCGSAYEQSIFCDVFHSTDSGWKECGSCGKRLHCGCIASRSLVELLDSGGVICSNCARNSGLQPVAIDEKPNGFDADKVHIASDLQPVSVNNQLVGSLDEIKLLRLGNSPEESQLRHFLQSENDSTNGSLGQMKNDDSLPPMQEKGNELYEADENDILKADIGAKDVSESPPQTHLIMNIGLGKSSPFAGVLVDEREHFNSSPPLLQGPRSRHLLPKPPRSLLAANLEANVGTVSQIRVARPPAEGRGRSQLLPRYWPRITDQELQQISGASNSTVVPLFEKMLSASDAGRIGRLVLPKACAEAYFPPISQPEGLPIRIQDVKGKEWVFQFRFWPNNNSRMYVLEGVTPCIQSMQLQAGDTVTFSRLDPEGKLIMGFRKAANTAVTQDIHYSAIHNGTPSSETFFSGVFENLPIISGYSGLKGITDPQLNPSPKHLIPSTADASWHKAEKYNDRAGDRLLLPSMLVPERKRARNIGTKSKRLLIGAEDALELKLTWEEVQDLLHPPPSVKPTKVMVEDHEFEEYEEPPVFAKRSIFVARSTGGQEQWVQCDNCSRWRKLPVDLVLPSKWTCADNAWDQSRNSCSSPDELTPRELEDLLRLNKEHKRRRMVTGNHTSIQDHESSGLDALANAAILGDSAGEPRATSVAATTKHPRHRPGCSCIVCIQPPSGKGKHKPTCTCNVCMTVKRRFKTLMMRKKKRQSEREAEIVQRTQHKWGPTHENELDTTSGHVNPSDADAQVTNELEQRKQSKLGESVKGQLDLNCYPDREEAQTQVGPNYPSMMSLLQVASLPLETYLKQNGLTSLITEPQSSSASQVPPQGTNESEGATPDNDRCYTPAAQQPESGCEELEQTPEKTQ